MSWSNLQYTSVSKVTLDIICLTAFGYDSDSLHNPSNELAEAYHDLISLQNGKRFNWQCVWLICVH